MRVIYIIGGPGAGKSTTLAAALKLLNWPTPTPQLKPLPHLYYGASRIQLGRLKPGNPFPGTDTLALNINPKACEWIATRPAELVLAEGDRLANSRFLDTCAEHGTLDLIWLDTPPNLARTRSLERSALHNTAPQTASWQYGRHTKVATIANSRPHTRLDGTQPTPTLAAQLANIIGD